MQFRNTLARALREPLMHFLLAGLAIFLFFGMSGGTPDIGDRRIVVNEEQVKRLANQWSQTWQRAPSPTELDGLIRDYIKEEIYYREGLRLGLDKDDVVVRRRLRSKMEFLETAEVENMSASDAELQAWLDRYPAKYASDSVFSFDQVYVSAVNGNEVAMMKAKSILGHLQEGAKPDAFGDPIALPGSQEAATAFDIDRQFGDEFVDALKSLPIGSWSGPVVSGFGLHLVRIRSLRAPHKPKLAEVRQAVENDWRNGTRENRESRAYQVLLDGYRIEIEKPE